MQHVFGHWYRESLISSLCLSLPSICDKHSCRTCKPPCVLTQMMKAEIVAFNAIDCTLNAKRK